MHGSSVARPATGNEPTSALFLTGGHWVSDQGPSCSAARGETLPVLFSTEPDLSAEEFRNILIASTLAKRRPVDDLPRLENMLRNADLIITARDSGRLVGIARAITDFSYCCYLSDLAVDVAYQRQGIGRRLIEATSLAAGDGATLIVVAAPAAESFYPKIGMNRLASCWSIPRAR